MAYGDALIIPLPSDNPLFTLRTTLDGLDFLLYFDWNGREDRYHLTISDVADVPIVRGLKVVDNWDLLRRVSDVRRPKGMLMAIDSLGLGPPTFHDLGPGRRVFLAYFPLIVTVATAITVHGG